uniref:Uncharacterized protein n=1 Tax=Panagrolaimus davidi TaxID=227884 RepID=A0A914QD32_9BILA
MPLMYTEAYISQKLDLIIAKLIIPLYPQSSQFTADVLKYMKFLISSGKVKRLELHSSSVINENDGIYEDLLDLIPSLRDLQLNYNPTRKFSPKFVEKICGSNLKEFNINELTEDFNYEEFLNSLKKKPKLDIHLYFLKSVNCKKIHTYIDKLLSAAGLTDIYPPYIQRFHPGIDWNRLNALERLRRKY